VNAFVPLDGGLLASGSCIGEIKIWNRLTGECIKSMQVPENFSVRALAQFDGGLLASGNGDGIIMIWNFSTGQRILSATEKLNRNYPSAVRAIVQLNGESFVSASDNDVIRVWNLSTGACLRTITVRPSPCDLVPLTSGLFATGSADGIKLWDLSTEKCVLYIDNRIDGLQSMAAKLVPLKNNRLACTAPHGAKRYYGRIAIWDLSKDKPVCCRVLVDRPREYEEEVKSLALLAEDLLASGYNDGTVNIWDLSTGKCLKTFKLKGPVRELVCHEGLLIAAVNNDIELWK
jgi:WD40 repeat protein